ncbi:MAG: outer membrane protein assembly factor BamE [Gammaproteobacteria bacterium]|nr:MAG: outer membrane protein assembly factor BamE [Gammaproteobacteria bacterium]
MKTRLMQKLLILSLLGGCSPIPDFLVYRIDIEQGNVITQDMVDALYIGMPKEEVRQTLGTPLLMDPFHPQRWDYLYTYQKGGGRREQRRLTVFFAEDRLVRLEGDVVAKRD